MLDVYKSDRHCVDITSQNFCLGDDLIKSIEAGNTYNLFLLDILMPGLNGIGLARKLRERCGDLPLIFLTSSADHALDAFRVSAMQYLLKPINKDDLFSVLDKVSDAIRQEKERCFMVPTTDQIVKVQCSSIIYVELNERKLMVYLQNGGLLKSRTIRTPFSEAISPLLEDENFISAHKSFVINMAHVEKLTGNSFIMDNGSELPIPRYKYAEAKAKYFTWLSKQGLSFLGGYQL